MNLTLLRNILEAIPSVFAIYLAFWGLYSLELNIPLPL
jgi:hypothetical protein